MNISFFCPAYLEEENIEQTINNAIKELTPISNSLEIIIIDDKSPDRTGEIADNLAKQYNFIRVIHHEENMGCGASIKTGFKEAKNDLIFYTDSDNQFEISDIHKLLPYLDEYDIVVGVRQPRADSIFRKIQSRVYNYLVNSLYNVNFKDVNCSFKIFKKCLIEDIELKSKSTFIDAEMMIKCVRKGLKVKEVEISHKPRTSGHATGSSIITILKALFEIIEFRGKL